jgi:DNA-binding NarL/FixJ family response regulator
VSTTDELIRPCTQPWPRAIAHCYPQPVPHAQPVPRTRGGSPVVVAIRASDDIVGTGAAAYLRCLPGIVTVPASRAPYADVVLVLARVITEHMVSWMLAAAREAVGTARFVLVTDGERSHVLQRAMACGMVTVLPWHGCDYARIVKAIQDARHGRPAADPFTAGAAPQGVRLEDRELAVLRLLADGLSTLEIAHRINYSERTVKNIIHAMLKRLNLKNRPHAVAFAMRNGLL